MVKNKAGGYRLYTEHLHVLVVDHDYAHSYGFTLSGSIEALLGTELFRTCCYGAAVYSQQPELMQKI